MSRQLKFRGKRIDNGEWVYGYPIIVSYKAWIKDINDTTTNPRRLAQDFADFRCVEVDPETVGQYTGKSVSTGEVYEGDIATSIDGTFLVVWNEEKAAFMMQFYTYPNECLYIEEMWGNSKVIGNIHDNPELLEAPHDNA